MRPWTVTGLRRGGTMVDWGFIGRSLAALLVHLLTASGAALGFFALLAAGEARFSAMFLWLGAALIVDGLDGPMARRFEVRRFAARYSGDILDLVVDYLTYVIVPTYALWTSGLLPVPFAILAATVICVTSALYFADTRMKTANHCFQGFPGVWNIVAFYIFLLTPPAPVIILFIVVCAALSFAPVPFVHPFRVRFCRPLTLGILAVGLGLAFYAVLQDLDPPALVRWILVAIGAYFCVIGYASHAK